MAESVNNIERFRKARGWSRPVLAKLMDTSPQQIERLENGNRRLSAKWIDLAANAFEVQPADIITASASEFVPTAEPDRLPTRTIGAGEMVEVTQLDLSLPMGSGATIDDYVEEEPVSFDLAYIRAFTRTPPARLRIARGVGDSMMPTLLPGDQVWIDSTRRNLDQSDKVWAVSINGAAAIKRLRPLRDGKVLVMSDNKTIGDYEVDADELLIAGRVIRFTRDI